MSREPLSAGRRQVVTHQAHSGSSLGFRLAGRPGTQSAIMRVGGGKKHGRYWIGDGAIDPVATPSLSQIRASSTSASPAIRPRQDTSHHRMEALQAQLEQERMMREVMQARMEADRQRMEEMEAHRQAQQEKMAEILQFMQTFGAAASVTPPPGLFAPPPPHQFSTPNQSAASNDPRTSPNLSPNQSGWSGW